MQEKKDEKEKVFLNHLKQRVQKGLGEGYEVRETNVTKNNNTELHGLIIIKQGINLAPTIYVDGFYRAHRWGMSLEDIADKIIEVYKKENLNDSLDMNFFRDYEKVKDRICFKLVNYEMNKKLLPDIPHVCFSDLAIVFFYHYGDFQGTGGTILIHNTHMEMWGIKNVDVLMEVARVNTPSIHELKFCSMAEILEGTDEEEIPDGGDEIPPMYVLGNKAHLFGAATILYDGVLEKIAKQLESDLIIIPSSVHEVIILKKEDADMKAVNKMLREVNVAQVDDEDILSNHIYIFRNNKLEAWEGEENE